MPVTRRHIRSFELGNDQSVILDALSRSELHVVSGTAWVTIERDPRDLFLNAGDALEVGASRVLVQGMGTVRVRLIERRAGPAGWIAARLRRARGTLQRRVTRLQFSPAIGEPSA